MQVFANRSNAPMIALYHDALVSKGLRSIAPSGGGVCATIGELAAVRCCSDTDCISVCEESPWGRTAGSPSQRAPARAVQSDAVHCLPTALLLNSTSAAAECAAHGRRLCRMGELRAGKCRRTGCGYDAQAVWAMSSDKCKPASLVTDLKRCLLDTAVGLPLQLAASWHIQDEAHMCQLAVAACPKRGVVLPGPGFNKVRALLDIPLQRQWSMTSLCASHMHPSARDQPICRSLHKLLRSVAADNVAREGATAAGCRVPMPTPREMQDVRKLRLLMIGDSHTRHWHQALQILTTGDFARGSSRLTKCACDGQFSEALDCRDSAFDQRAYTERAGGAVAVLVDLAQPGVSNATAAAALAGLCSSLSTPAVVLLQAGFHYAMRFDKARAHFFNPMIQQARALPCIRAILVSGVTVQHTGMDAVYPKQARQYVLNFNQALTSWAKVEGLLLLDLGPASLRFENATSDGVHHLASFNVWKASVLVHTLRLLFPTGASK